MLEKELRVLIHSSHQLKERDTGPDLGSSSTPSDISPPTGSHLTLLNGVTTS